MSVEARTVVEMLSVHQDGGIVLALQLGMANIAHIFPFSGKK